MRASSPSRLSTFTFVHFVVYPNQRTKILSSLVWRFKQLHLGHHSESDTGSHQFYSLTLTYTASQNIDFPFWNTLYTDIHYYHTEIIDFPSLNTLYTDIQYYPYWNHWLSLLKHPVYRYTVIPYWKHWLSLLKHTLYRYTVIPILKNIDFPSLNKLYTDIQ